VMSAVWFICVLLTAGMLLYIFYLHGRFENGPEKTRADYLRERRDAVYENLRDLNFEYKAGKLPEIDYRKIKASLEEEAAAILAEIARLASGPLSKNRKRAKT
jgi:hypothetical protein